LIPFIKDVQAQGIAYYLALDSSIDTAVDGYAFSESSEYLCECLLNPNSTLDDLKDYITDMREKARRAHLDATTVSEKFRSVRQGLNQITQGIPVSVAVLQEQEQRARELKAIAERKCDRLKKLTYTATATAGVFSGCITIGLAFPHALLILPVLLPVLVLISNTSDAHYSSQVVKRETEEKNCIDAVKQLQEAARDLSMLVYHIDMFANWWLEMDTMLEAIEINVGQIQADHIVKLRVKGVKKQWGEVKMEYAGYKSKISKLQDYYPSSRRQGSTSVVGSQ